MRTVMRTEENQIQDFINRLQHFARLYGRNFEIHFDSYGEVGEFVVNHPTGEKTVYSFGKYTLPGQIIKEEYGK